MSQSQYIQGGVQVEAGRELGKILRPAVAKIVGKARSFHWERRTVQEHDHEGRAERPVGQIKVQEG